MRYPCSSHLVTDQTVTMASNVSAGDVVLLVWCEGQSPERVKELVERLQEKVGSSGQVKIENAERLKHCKYSEL